MFGGTTCWKCRHGFVSFKAKTGEPVSTKQALGDHDQEMIRAGPGDQVGIIEADDRQVTTVFTTVIPPSALDKPSIMKRYYRRRTCSHTSPRRLPTMVTLHDTRFVECRCWNDGWTTKTVVIWRSSASTIPAPDFKRLLRLEKYIEYTQLRCSRDSHVQLRFGVFPMQMHVKVLSRYPPPPPPPSSCSYSRYLF